MAYKQLNFDPDGEYQFTRKVKVRVSDDYEKVDKAAEDAKHQSEITFPGLSGYADKRDAMRHALWSYYMTIELGAEKAKIITDSWERPIGEAGDDLMDLYNNKIGRDLAQIEGATRSGGKAAVYQALQENKLQIQKFKIFESESGE